MATLNITAEELDYLIDLKDQGRIAEAWNFLGEKGDAYAFLAGAIVSDDTSGMPLVARLFYEMVRSQWENTTPAGVWGGEVFMGVPRHGGQPGSGQQPLLSRIHRRRRHHRTGRGAPGHGRLGLVRDLREAASLSPRLAELLTQYSAATTRDAQWALLDELLDAWADTSGMAGLNERNPERVALSTAQTVRVHVI